MTLTQEDIQILCAMAHVEAAYGQMLASNNTSLATCGNPGDDPSMLINSVSAYAALSREAAKHGLIDFPPKQSEVLHHCPECHQRTETDSGPCSDCLNRI